MKTAQKRLGVSRIDFCGIKRYTGINGILTTEYEASDTYIFLSVSDIFVHYLLNATYSILSNSNPSIFVQVQNIYAEKYDALVESFDKAEANYNSSTRDTMFSEYPEMLDTKQLCQALGCSEKYVYKLIREGKLPKLKGIRSVRVPKVFLINFVLQGAQESGE